MIKLLIHNYGNKRTKYQITNWILSSSNPMNLHAFFHEIFPNFKYYSCFWWFFLPNPDQQTSLHLCRSYFVHAFSLTSLVLNPAKILSKFHFHVFLWPTIKFHDFPGFQWLIQFLFNQYIISILFLSFRLKYQRILNSQQINFLNNNHIV